MYRAARSASRCLKPKGKSMNLKTIIFACFCAAGMAAPALALQGFTLKCDLTTKGPHGGFGDLMFVGFEDGWKNPAVLDAQINEIHKTPIPVNLLSNSGKRARIGWELKGLKYREGTSIGRVIYKGSIDKTTLNIRMESLIPSNSGRYFAEGQCEKIK